MPAGSWRGGSDRLGALAAASSIRVRPEQFDTSVMDHRMDVVAWLRGLGLDQYAQLFRDNDIDGEILCGMTAEDLKELGISSFGHRRKLLNAITALGGEPPTRDVAQSADFA